MARFLGIDWDQHQLRVVEASLRGGRISVHQAVSWPESLNLGTLQAEEAGERLRQRLQEAGIAPAPVVYILGQDQALVREVLYPDVPEEEIAAVVHFQAAKELSVPAEDGVIDYALVDIPGAEGEKRALAWFLRKDWLLGIRKLCQAAGLRLENVSVRPYGMLANWQTQVATEDRDAGPSALFMACNDGGELCVVRGSELLFSRILRPAGEPEKISSFLPELRRSLAAFASHFPGQPVQTLFVAGDTGTTQRQALEAVLGLTVKTLNLEAGLELPDISPAIRDSFAVILGILQARTKRGGLPVDFLAPKLPPAPTRRKKYILVAASATLALLLAGGGWWYGMAASGRNSEIEELQALKTSLQKQIAALADVDKQLEAVATWAEGEVVVLDELYDLIARFPDQAGIRVTRVAWAPVPAPPPSAPGKPGTANNKLPASPLQKPVAQISLEIRADSANALESVRQALKAERSWKLELWERENLGAFQARALLKVFPREPHQYQLLLGKTVHTTAVGNPIEVPRGPGGSPILSPPKANGPSGQGGQP